MKKLSSHFPFALVFLLVGACSVLRAQSERPKEKTLYDRLMESPVEPAEKDLVDPFAEKPPTRRQAAAYLKAMREQFKDILATRKKGGRLDGTEEIAGIPSEKLMDYFLQTGNAAQEVLQKIQPKQRLPEPVLLPQVIRYLNAEMASRKLPYHIQLSLSESEEPRYDNERWRTLLFHAMPAEGLWEDKRPTMSLPKALREGSLWDILWGLTDYILPHASLNVYKTGLILLAPNT
jgi:hypothetical protein